MVPQLGHHPLLVEHLQALDPQWPAADFDVDAEKQVSPILTRDAGARPHLSASSTDHKRKLNGWLGRDLDELERTD